MELPQLIILCIDQNPHDCGTRKEGDAGKDDFLLLMGLYNTEKMDFI